MKIFFQLFLLFFVPILYAQQETKMLVVLDASSNLIYVNQTIQFTNQSESAINTIILNDWNNAYSDKFSPLGIRFSDEFVRRFHMATDSERGKTTITSLKVNNDDNLWNRVKNQIDLVEIPLQKALNTNETVTLEISYTLKIPSVMFTKFGEFNQNFYLKNTFLTIARVASNGKFVSNSNENLEDIANENLKQIDVDFVIPKNYQLTTNLTTISEKEDENLKTIKCQANNLNQIQLALEKQNTYEIFKNATVEIQTNLNDSKVDGVKKAIIIDKVVNYIAENLGQVAQKKIMVSQVDYERNPFYGLNQLPTFLSPFPNEFLYELKFLKSYLYNYLHATLKIDPRKDAYIFDAIQAFTMMTYIEQNYPNFKMIGNISKFKILRGYALARADFNNQYYYLYLLMARKNLDQGLSESKEELIKFNEQIASKYKAGLIFKYLDTYLQKDIVNKSFKEFVQLNQSQKTDATQFETIIKNNTNQNIDWFFNDLIRSRNSIDYTFGNVSKGKDSTTFVIRNNSKATVPISLYGFKNKKIVFTQWLNNVKIDTTVTIQKDVADKLVLNYNNEVPEFNLTI